MKFQLIILTVCLLAQGRAGLVDDFESLVDSLEARATLPFFNPISKLQTLISKGENLLETSDVSSSNCKDLPLAVAEGLLVAEKGINYTAEVANEILKLSNDAVTTCVSLPITQQPDCLTGYVEKIKIVVNGAADELKDFEVQVEDAYVDLNAAILQCLGID